MSIDLAKKRFHDMAYGMFIHYGLYSIPARGEWLLCRERMPQEEYFRWQSEFKTPPGLARSWVELAQAGGMKYLCLVTRHHDGFFVGDALVREFCDACREAGLGVGLYYSVGDWSDPDFGQGPDAAGWPRFVAKTHRQVIELIRDYGKVDYLFYDGCPPPEYWQAAELHHQLRQLQPELLISSRCGLEEDVASSENHSGSHPGLWESCYTMNDSWGYNQYDQNWKSPAQIITMLTQIVHNGGNLLLNVGPRPDGSVHPREVEIIHTIGEWLKCNGEAIYGVEPHPFHYIDQEISTGRGNTVYITVAGDYLGSKRIICGIGNRINRITLLETGAEIDFRQEHDRLFLTGLSEKAPEGLPRVLKLELDGAPYGIHNPMWPKGRFRVC